MLKLNYTKGFYFDFAQYRVSDGYGNEALLKVDYKNNKFKLEENGNPIGKDFRTEIETFAKDMLARKHAVNFAQSS